MIEFGRTVQLLLGQPASLPLGRSGASRVGDAVICPLRGVTDIVSPCSGPKSNCFGAGSLPPLLTHCRSADPPDDVRNMSIGSFPKPAALKLTVRLKLRVFSDSVGPLTKCGFCAAASIGVISSKADAIIAAGIATPLLISPSILSQLK